LTRLVQKLQLEAEPDCIDLDTLDLITDNIADLYFYQIRIELYNLQLWPQVLHQQKYQLSNRS